MLNAVHTTPEEFETQNWLVRAVTPVRNFTSIATYFQTEATPVKYEIKSQVYFYDQAHLPH